LINQIEDQAKLLQAQYNINAEEIIVLFSGLDKQESLNKQIYNARLRQLLYEFGAQKATLIANAVSASGPKVLGVIAGMAGGVIADPSFGWRGVVQLAGVVASEV